ncbi:MAG: DNRLRE domain-containing protein, partial [Phycisphaerales bacterium]|nr:DNRLRE domain-containing protein [Phycisphaerales bacterium]
MNTRLLTPLSALFLGLLASDRAPAQEAFTIIGLPDTQVYSELYPEIFASQTEWIVEQKLLRDIRYVSHYGDIVENGDNIVEWLIGDAAMYTLDIDGIPYGVNAGNHDVTASGFPGQSYMPENYLEFFGPWRFKDREWFKGSSPSGMSSYQLITGGGREFLMLNLECDTPLRELEWAQGILDRNRDKPVFLTTHRYLQDSDDYTGDIPIVGSGRYPAAWYIFENVWTPDGIQSNQFFKWFVRRNPNIFMVNCGHFSEEFRQQSANVEGGVVHEVLADYQSDTSGGNGFLRIMRFDVAGGRIDVESYSPWVDDFHTEDESRFALYVDFDSYATEQGVAVFHQDINEYEGTLDTWINEGDPDTAYGDEDTRNPDDDVYDSIFTDYRGQALLRFEDILGPVAEGKVPENAKVTRAILSIEIEDDIDNPLFNPDFEVWEVTRDWDESSTWNSLDGGLTTDQDLGALLATFPGDNDPNSESLRRIDITSAVQSWVNGEPNCGVAFLPEIITGNDDGIAIWTSEAGNPLFRPTLEVWFDPGTVFNPADLNGDGLVDGADLAIVLADWGSTSSPADIN